MKWIGWRTRRTLESVLAFTHRRLCFWHSLVDGYILWASTPVQLLITFCRCRWKWEIFEKSTRHIWMAWHRLYDGLAQFNTTRTKCTHTFRTEAVNYALIRQTMNRNTLGASKYPDAGFVNIDRADLQACTYQTNQKFRGRVGDFFLIKKRSVINVGLRHVSQCHRINLFESRRMENGHSLRDPTNISHPFCIAKLSTVNLGRVPLKVIQFIFSVFRISPLVHWINEQIDRVSSGCRVPWEWECSAKIYVRITSSASKTFRHERYEWRGAWHFEVFDKHQILYTISATVSHFHHSFPNTHNIHSVR